MCYFLGPVDGTSQYPCGICHQNVSPDHKAILCDFCNYHNHIECLGIDNKTYDALEDIDFHCCKICEEEMLSSPKTSLDDEIVMIENLNLNILTTPNFPESPIEEEISCGFCLKRVSLRHKSVQCDLCDKWHHIRCDGIDNKTYESLKKIKQI